MNDIEYEKIEDIEYAKLFDNSDDGENYGMAPSDQEEQMLDEHIQKTMIIASSPYAKFFLSDVLYWKQHLVKVQEVLEEWSRV